MRLVVPTEENTVAINYTWLPTFMGMNAILLTDIGDTIKREFKGKPLDNANLDLMHTRVAELLCERFKMEGLAALFEVLRRVEP